MDAPEEGAMAPGHRNVPGCSQLMSSPRYSNCQHEKVSQKRTVSLINYILSLEPSHYIKFRTGFKPKFLLLVIGPYEIMINS